LGDHLRAIAAATSQVEHVLGSGESLCEPIACDVHRVDGLPTGAARIGTHDHPFACYGQFTHAAFPSAWTTKHSQGRTTAGPQGRWPDASRSPPSTPPQRFPV